MPRYFFHTDGSAPFHDATGVDLADDDAAWSQAVVAFGELLRDIDGKLPDGEEITITVVDEAGRPIATLRFAGERSRAPMRDGVGGAAGMPHEHP